MRKYAEYVKNKLSKRELLEQLAEECMELGMAALKLIRAEGLSGNVTPVKANEATANFFEEVGDVLMCVYILTDVHELEFITCNIKWQRWAKRLGYKEGAE